MKKIWPFSFYFLNFAGFVLVLPFLVIFYQTLNFTGAQIGLLTGIPPLVTLLIAPLGTGLGDQTHRHKLIMSLGLMMAMMVGVALPNISSFAVVFGVTIVYNILSAHVGQGRLSQRDALECLACVAAPEHLLRSLAMRALATLA